MNEKVFEKLGQKIVSKLISTDDENEENFANLCKLITNSKNIMNLNFKNPFIFELFVSAEKLSSQNYIERIYKRLNFALNSGVGMIILLIKNYSLICKINLKCLNDFFSNISKISHCHATKIFIEVSSAYGRADDKHLYLNCFRISASSSKDNKNTKSINKHPSDIFLNKLISQLNKIYNLAISCGFDGACLNFCEGIFGELSSIELNNLFFGHFNEIQDVSQKFLSKTNFISRKIPTICRINLSSMIKELFSNDYLQIKSINKIRAINNFSLLFELVKKLVTNGVDGFILSLGTFETAFINNFTPFLGENLFEDLYASFLDEINKDNVLNKFNEKPFLVYNDKFNAISSAIEKVDKQMPFVILTKQILADNSYLTKSINGSKIIPCIRCFYCDKIFKLNGIHSCIFHCISSYFQNITQTSAKNICVVGGGISGLVCALILAREGHSVEIFEKNYELNLTGKHCEIFGLDKLFSTFNKYLKEQISDLVFKNRIKLNLGQTFVASNSIEKYTDIVIATGFLEKSFNVNGAVLKQVISLYDALATKTTFLSVENVTILAKTELSFKLAVYLLSKKVSVSIILEDNNLIKNLSDESFSYYMQVFSKNKTEIYPLSRLNKINEDCCEIIFNHRFSNKNCITLMYNIRSGERFKFVPQIKTIFSDLFVYEPELSPNCKLLYDIVNSHFSGNVFMIGNALKIGTLFEDINSAIYVASNI